MKSSRRIAGVLAGAAALAWAWQHTDAALARRHTPAPSAFFQLF